MMILGIEIGGTKLQLGIGDGTSPQLETLQRLDVQAERGAQGILQQIGRAAASLVRQYPVSRIGIGFGGPVHPASGRVIKSHQIAGWDNVPLARWCQQQLGLDAVVGNDCDVAALAEATWGAGRGKSSAFYVTVGTGIGGGFVVHGRLHGAGRPAASEIGHLRPGPAARQSTETVESLASGPGIAAAARARLEDDSDDAFPDDRQDVLRRAGGEAARVTAEIIAQAAAEGNRMARHVLEDACQTLGWAVAQTITLLAPEVVVVGGGVSLIGEQLFFAPLRAAVRQYVFPPLREAYEIAPAALGEQAVVHGAIALACSRSGSEPQ
jgi:glucokinase